MIAAHCTDRLARAAHISYRPAHAAHPPHPIDRVDAADGQTADAVIEAVQINQTQAACHKPRAFPLLCHPVDTDERQNQKRQIIDEHQLVMRVEEAVCRRIQHRSESRRARPGGLTAQSAAQPPKQQIRAEDDACQTVSCQKVFHPDLRKQTAKQYVRPQQTVVGKVIDRAAAAQMQIQRKQPAGVQHRAAQRLGQRQMLTEPVRTIAEKFPAHRRRPQCQKQRKAAQQKMRRADSSASALPTYRPFTARLVRQPARHPDAFRSYFHARVRPRRFHTPCFPCRTLHVFSLIYQMDFFNNKPHSKTSILKWGFYFF